MLSRRKDSGLSLQRLGDRVGVSRAFLSMLERGETTVSTKKLYRICEALGVSVADLFVLNGSSRSRQAEVPAPAPTAVLTEAGPVVNPDERHILDLDCGVRWEGLTNRNGPADFLRVTYEPGGSSTSDRSFTRHAGVEYGYIQSGTLHVSLARSADDIQTYALAPGSAISFDSSTPHLLENRSDEPVQAIWLVVRNP